MSYKDKSPVFIVGMPRSGTKLMRSLLSQHSFVSIALFESHFIPYFINVFGEDPSFKSKDDLVRVADEFEKTEFALSLKKAGKTLNREHFYNAVDFRSWESIFKYLIKSFGTKSYEMDVIWGDKTPGYINHILLLKKIFPNSHFIHMIRDPRDYSLSVAKGWGKRLERAAERWRVAVERAQSIGKAMPERYIEASYEELVTDTKSLMIRVCDFLNIPFEEKVTSLEAPTPEDVGDVKGIAQIVSTNTKKYKKALSKKQVKRVEEIVYPVMKNMPYQFEYAEKFKPVGFFSNLYYKCADGFAIIRFRLKERGAFKGIRYTFNHYTKSSWR